MWEIFGNDTFEFKVLDVWGGVGDRTRTPPHRHSNQQGSSNPYAFFITVNDTKVTCQCTPSPVSLGGRWKLGGGVTRCGSIGVGFLFLSAVIMSVLPTLTFDSWSGNIKS